MTDFAPHNWTHNCKTITWTPNVFQKRLFTKAGYRTDRKHVPHSSRLKKADLLIKDFELQGVRDVIVDVTCRHEFRGAYANQERNGEPSHLDVDGALDAAVKEKLDHYQHDYNECNSSSSLQPQLPQGESAETFFVYFTYCLTDK
jgi:hypothetical protein